VTVIFSPDKLFPSLLRVAASLKLVDLFEAGAGRHELKDAVHADHGPNSTLDDRGLETTPYLDSMLL